eukprot:Hpha_TRINITY_DN16375_c1_g2::TRINITY_DN16375_c1_g2_i3::g.62925::m.62925
MISGQNHGVTTENVDETPVLVQYSRPVAAPSQLYYMSRPQNQTVLGHPMQPTQPTQPLQPQYVLRLSSHKSEPPRIVCPVVCHPTPPMPPHSTPAGMRSPPASAAYDPSQSFTATNSSPHTPTAASSMGSVSRDHETSQDEDVLVVVQFKWGRLGDFKSNLALPVGTSVIVEADRGIDLGVVQSIDTQRSPAEAEWRIVREATRKEQERWQKQFVTRELAAKKRAQTILEEAGVHLQILHAEYQFDKKKLTFHYTSSETRPNFRSALDDLFAAFRCRVWFARYTGEKLERDRANAELVAARTQSSEKGHARKQSTSSSEGRDSSSAMDTYIDPDVSGLAVPVL